MAGCGRLFSITLTAFYLCLGVAIGTFTFITTDTCFCPGVTIVLECRVVGGVSTAYRATGCQPDDFTLPHSDFVSQPPGECGCGSTDPGPCIRSESVSIDGTTYVSRLTITGLTSMTLLTVECFLDNGTRILIGNETIASADSLPVSNIHLLSESPNLFVIGWDNPATPSQCPIRNDVSTSNCGSCDSTTRENNVNCNFNNAHRPEGVCRVTVCTSICGADESPVCTTETLSIPRSTSTTTTITEQSSTNKLSSDEIAGIVLGIVGGAVVAVVAVVVAAIIVKKKRTSVKRKSQDVSRLQLEELDGKTTEGDILQPDKMKQLASIVARTVEQKIDEKFDEQMRKKEKDEELEEKNRIIREIQRDVNKNNEEIEKIRKEKDEEIRRLQREKEDLLKQKNAELQQKDAEIQRIKKEKDQQISSLQESNKLLLERMSSLEDQVTSLTGELESVNQTVHRLETELGNKNNENDSNIEEHQELHQDFQHNVQPAIDSEGSRNHNEQENSKIEKKDTMTKFYGQVSKVTENVTPNMSPENGPVDSSISPTTTSTETRHTESDKHLDKCLPLAERFSQHSSLKGTGSNKNGAVGDHP